MLERRRSPRYELAEAIPGEAMPMQDVIVERYAGDRLVVIAHDNPARDEQLMIHMTTTEGLASHRAEVVASHPIAVAGSLCYRLELQIGPAEPKPEARRS